MPANRFALLILAVIAAAALTVWLAVSTGGMEVLAWLLPVGLALSLALRFWGRR